MASILNYALIFLMIFGSLGWFFKANSPKSTKVKELSRICPCHRMAEAGLLSKILVYTSIGAYVFNGLYIKFADVTTQNICQLLMATYLAFLAYKVQKEEEYDRDKKTS